MARTFDLIKEEGDDEEVDDSGRDERRRGDYVCPSNLRIGDNLASSDCGGGGVADMIGTWVVTDESRSTE
jgi:hypothetical protein